MDTDERLELITRNTQEVITTHELKKSIESRARLTGYIGVEPSGLLPISWIIWIEKLKDLINAGVDMTVLLATWHALINDKLGGNIGNIGKCAEYIKQCLEALEVDLRKASFVYAEDLIGEPGYWTTLLRLSKHVSLARAKRALTILGRKKGDLGIDFAKLIYPSMQVTDIFMLDVDLCLGGEDQRRAHVLAREIAPKLGRKKPIAVHTPLLVGLQGTNRMDTQKMRREEILVDAKMSKSRPASSIFIHDEPEEIREKIMKAYCPPGEVEMNPVLEIARYLIFPRVDKLVVTRAKGKKRSSVFRDYSDLACEYARGLHPLDVKMAVAESLSAILRPVRLYFKRKPKLLKEIRTIST